MAERGKGKYRVGAPEKRIEGDQVNIARAIAEVSEGIQKLFPDIGNVPNAGDYINRVGNKESDTGSTPSKSGKNKRQSKIKKAQSVTSSGSQKAGNVSNSMGLRKDKTGLQV